MTNDKTTGGGEIFNHSESLEVAQVISQLSSIPIDSLSYGEQELAYWKEKIAILNINQCKGELAKIVGIFQNELNLQSDSELLLEEIETIIEDRIASLEKESFGKRVKGSIIVIVIAFMSTGLGSYIYKQDRINNQAQRVLQAQNYKELNNDSDNITEIRPTNEEELKTVNIFYSAAGTVISKEKLTTLEKNKLDLLVRSKFELPQDATIGYVFKELPDSKSNILTINRREQAVSIAKKYGFKPLNPLNGEHLRLGNEGSKESDFDEMFNRISGVFSDDKFIIKTSDEGSSNRANVYIYPKK